MLPAAEKEALYKKADHRMKARGAPYFGVCEKDVLLLRNEFEHFKTAWTKHMEQANKNFTHLQSVPRELSGLKERVQNLDFHGTTLLNILVEKGVLSHEEMQIYLDETTFQSFGLTKTHAPAIEGDTAILGFVLSCEGQIVDDKEQAKMAYLVGSADMPIDEHIVGLSAGEEKTVDFIWPEDKPFEGLGGKPVSMRVLIRDVRRRDMARVQESA